MRSPAGEPVLWIANLDAEQRWAGRAGRTLPRRLLERLATFGSLFRLLARGDDVLWLPAPLDPDRLPPLPDPDGGTRRPVRRLDGPPGDALGRLPRHRPRPWADAEPWVSAERSAVAARVNDRRFALELGRRLGVDDPRTRVIRDLDALDESGRRLERWVVKAPISASGRQRHVHLGGPLDDARPAVRKLLQRHGELVFEPWHARDLDLGVLFDVPFGERGRSALRVHRQTVGVAGAVTALELGHTPPSELADLAPRVAAALAAAGYRGPAGVDAWRHRGRGGERRWHALGEINARWSLGRLAYAAADALPGWREVPHPRLETGDRRAFALARDRAGTAAVDMRFQPLVLPTSSLDGIWLSGAAATGEITGPAKAARSGPPSPA